MRSVIALLALCSWLAVLAGCGAIDDAAAPAKSLAEIVKVDKVSLNPARSAPLSALLELETTDEVTLVLRVMGRNGSASDVVHEVSQPATEFEVPVLGLYPDFSNTLEVTFFDMKGRDLGTRIYVISTDPLSADLPEIAIEVADGSPTAQGFTFVSYMGYGVGRNPLPKRPFMFDRFGDIRWYLDLANHPDLSGLHYGTGMERLLNGNLYFGDIGTDRIYEISMLGEVLTSWDLPGYEFHHEVIEKPDGNFLVTVDKQGEATIEDHVIEIDRLSGAITNVWDLRQSLDYDRIAIRDDRVDWFHLNAVVFDESDDTIIVSGRNQGLVKLTASNEVVWIVSPHEGWGTSGTGIELSQFLLQPLDADGEPIMDQAAIDGVTNHASFEWPWQQHSPLIMPSGNLMVFDNGWNRNFGEGDVYSRAVEYDIREDAMTIQQVWSYGSERGPEAYAPIVSDVDYLASEDRVILSPGAIKLDGDSFGKVIEVSREGQLVVFEARIIPPVAAQYDITLHRTERLPIYPAIE